MKLCESSCTLSLLIWKPWSPKLFSLSSIRMEERVRGEEGRLYWVLLSPALSSLVPREEREKAIR
jgi:hypothetical protein